MTLSADVIGLPGWLHLVYFGVLLPLTAWRGAKRMKEAGGPPPDRLRHFRGTAVTIVLLAGLSLMVAHVEWIELFPPRWPPLRAVLAGLVAYALAVAAMRPRWRRAVERRNRVVHLFMPANGRERGWWIAVSLLAGIGEEITWRGVQATLAAAVTGSLWIGALLSAASFGAAHVVQGWKSAAIIAVFALGFSALVALSGSLYVAMAVHIAYDITAGITYGRLGRQLGYTLDPAAPTASGA